MNIFVPGLFLNGFQSTADDNYDGSDTVDANTAYNDEASVTFTNAFNVLGGTGVDAAKNIKVRYSSFMPCCVSYYFSSERN